MTLTIFRRRHQNRHCRRRYRHHRRRRSGGSAQWQMLFTTPASSIDAMIRHEKQRYATTPSDAFGCLFLWTVMKEIAWEYWGMEISHYWSFDVCYAACFAVSVALVFFLLPSDGLGVMDSIRCMFMLFVFVSVIFVLVWNKWNCLCRSLMNLFSVFNYNGPSFKKKSK